MGVNTLLKHLAPCLEDSHVERFRGKTVAVDGNTFIFRGCYSCSEQVRCVVTCTLVFRGRENLKFAELKFSKCGILGSEATACNSYAFLFLLHVNCKLRAAGTAKV